MLHLLSTKPKLSTYIQNFINALKWEIIDLVESNVLFGYYNSPSFPLFIYCSVLCFHWQRSILTIKDTQYRLADKLVLTLQQKTPATPLLVQLKAVSERSKAISDRSEAVSDIPKAIGDRSKAISDWSKAIKDRSKAISGRSKTVSYFKLKVINLKL